MALCKPSAELHPSFYCNKKSDGEHETNKVKLKDNEVYTPNAHDVNANHRYVQNNSTTTKHKHHTKHTSTKP